MYDELMAALYEKAAAGVEVRMMVDEMGSLSTLPKDFYQSCAAHRIKSIPYNPLSPSLFKFISFRDHRKMTIVDGRVALPAGLILVMNTLTKRSALAIGRIWRCGWKARRCLALRPCLLIYGIMLPGQSPNWRPLREQCTSSRQ